MNVAALILSVGLAAPGVQLLPDRLAVKDVERTLPAEPVEITPERPLTPLALIATGIALVAGGLVAMAIDSECPTRDADFRCNDPRGGSVVMPSLVVLGLAFTVTGEHWRRTTEPREP